MSCSVFYSKYSDPSMQSNYSRVYHNQAETWLLRCTRVTFFGPHQSWIAYSHQDFLGKLSRVLLGRFGMNPPYIKPRWNFAANYMITFKYFCVWGSFYIGLLLGDSANHTFHSLISHQPPSCLSSQIFSFLFCFACRFSTNSLPHSFPPPLWPLDWLICVTAVLSPIIVAVAPYLVPFGVKCRPWPLKQMHRCWPTVQVFSSLSLCVLGRKISNEGEKRNWGVKSVMNEERRWEWMLTEDTSEIISYLFCSTFFFLSIFRSDLDFVVPDVPSIGTSGYFLQYIHLKG